MRNLLLNFLERLETSIYKFNGNGNGNGKYGVSELPKHELRFESKPFEVDVSAALQKKPLDIAITSSQQYLFREQNQADGHWVGILEAENTVTSDYILLMHFLGKVDYEKQRKAVNYIIDQQLHDGGWNIYHGGPREISASVKAYFALKLAGYSALEPFMQRAQKSILEMGGIMKANCFTNIYLAIFGQVDWQAVPAVPGEVRLFP